MAHDPNNIATWSLQRQAERLWQVEGGHCVSHLVSMLATAANSGSGQDMGDLGAAMDQAFELACPIDDWEEAAREAGWKPSSDDAEICKDGEEVSCSGADRWQVACERGNLEPYQREVFEHWIVSDWLADQLAAQGEKVDKDFAGLTIWARTTTGQAVYVDGVIERIAAATYGREG